MPDQSNIHLVAFSPHADFRVRMLKHWESKGIQNRHVASDWSSLQKAIDSTPDDAKTLVFAQGAGSGLTDAIVKGREGNTFFVLIVSSEAPVEILNFYQQGLLAHIEAKNETLPALSLLLANRLSNEPAQDIAFSNLCPMLEKEKMFPVAISLAQNILQMQPTSDHALTVAKLQFKYGYFNEGRTAIDQALALGDRDISSDIQVIGNQFEGAILPTNAYLNIAQKYKIDTAFIIEPDLAEASRLQEACSKIGLTNAKIFTRFDAVPEEKPHVAIFSLDPIFGDSLSPLAYLQRLKKDGEGVLAIGMTSQKTRLSDPAEQVLYDYNVFKSVTKPVRAAPGLIASSISQFFGGNAASSSKDFCDQILAAYKRKNNVDAETLYRKAMKTLDKTGRSHVEAAVAYSNRQFDRAESLLMGIVKSWKKEPAARRPLLHSDIFVMLASCLLKRGQHDDAKAIASVAASLSPNNISVLLLAADVFKHSDLKKSDEFIISSIKIDNTIEILERVDGIAMREGSAWDTLLSPSPELARIANNEGVTLSRLGMVEKAIELFRRALEVAVDDSYRKRIEYNLALSFAKTNDLPAAKTIAVKLSTAGGHLGQKSKSLLSKIEQAISSGTAVKLSPREEIQISSHDIRYLQNNAGFCLYGLFPKEVSG